MSFLSVYIVFEVIALALIVVLVIWGYLFWDRRYRGAQGPADAFQPTEEVFRDPTSGNMLRVFFNPTTGERQYREPPEQGPGGAP